MTASSECDRRRTIRVTGKGRIKVKPDMTRITLSLEGIYPEYGETLRRSSQDTERLKDLLAGFGFERTDLKTLNFSVDTEYERSTRAIRIREHTNSALSVISSAI